MFKNIIFPILMLIVLLAITHNSDAQIRDQVRIHTDPEQDIYVPYRLFNTNNIWHFLLLDTVYGRVWQVSFSIDDRGARSKIPINLTPLVSPEDGDIGRFTLYPTENMWNFLLVDQYDGRVWQVQFSTTLGNQFILPIR